MSDSRDPATPERQPILELSRLRGVAEDDATAYVAQLRIHFNEWLHISSGRLVQMTPVRQSDCTVLQIASVVLKFMAHGDRWSQYPSHQRESAIQREAEQIGLDVTTFKLVMKWWSTAGHLVTLT